MAPRKQKFKVPLGMAPRRPDELAEQHGALIYDYFESVHEANFRLASDPNRFHTGR
jgi:hypothetical protein